MMIGANGSPTTVTRMANVFRMAEFGLEILTDGPTFWHASEPSSLLSSFFMLNDGSGAG
jgi:hypothetical protein